MLPTSQAGPDLTKVSRMRGAAKATNSADRQACISISSDWLSCSTMPRARPTGWRHQSRSEEHTSELQSHLNLVCRLLLEKKKKNIFALFFYKNKKKKISKLKYKKNI